MVIILGMVFAAQQSADPLLEQLDPPRRAAVVMALLGIVLVGLLLVAIVMLGANWVRRLARHRPGEYRSTAAESASNNERLRESLRVILPGNQSGDTVHLDTSSKETRMDSP